MKNKILLCFILLLLPVDAFAFGEIQYSTCVLNIRRGMSKSSAVIGTLYPNQKVRVFGCKDGWAPIYEPWMDSSNAKVLGYVAKDYLSPTQSGKPENIWSKRKIVNKKSELKSRPNLTSHSLGSLEKGTVVLSVLKSKSDWAPIFNNSSTINSQLNIKGWVPSVSLSNFHKTNEMVKYDSSNEGKADGLDTKVLGDIRYRVRSVTRKEWLGAPVDEYIIELFWEGQTVYGSKLRDFSMSFVDMHKSKNKHLFIKLYLHKMNLQERPLVRARYFYDDRFEFWVINSSLYGTKYFSETKLLP
ncbi:SH3 domain-containing protein [Salidesulfovibrio brasiliensis]|uniref:SH3 domain-containing protein n=1 Tax=Salidesulfovibrio brasiliensis TaxID=221711 RepID=UPI000AC5128E|nr:SH3 domain-containing protein [Salidesulfovibrio brasiliensis]